MVKEEPGAKANRRAAEKKAKTDARIKGVFKRGAKRAREIGGITGEENKDD